MFHSKKFSAKINSKVEGIVRIEAKLYQCTTEFRTLLKEKKILFEQASESDQLYKMFLRNCGNELLVRLLDAGNHMGRTGSADAVDAFKRIWYVIFPFT